MRRFLHLAPFLVLFGALLASFPTSAKDVFLNETLADFKSASGFLKDTEEFDESLLDLQAFPHFRVPRNIRFPISPSKSKHLLTSEKFFIMIFYCICR